MALIILVMKKIDLNTKEIQLVFCDSFLNPHVLSYPLHAYGCGKGSSFFDPNSQVCTLQLQAIQG